MNEFDTNTKRESARRWTKALVTTSAMLLLGLASLIGAKGYVMAEAGPEAAAPADAAIATGAPLPAAEGVADAQTLSKTFSSVAKVVGPAVVHINVTSEVATPTAMQGFPFPFGGDDGSGGGMHKERGSGSGVIVNQNGYILTNNHVVGNASKIEVKLADGRILKGSVVGTDRETDLAVVKVDAAGLPTASLGDSDVLEQGDWVIAMGSPFGLEQTITAGIVSATGRRLQGASLYDAFIQTDASINPGNSGGPLVNLRGEVVGINTLIYSRSGGNQGIGFAVPSVMARKVYDQLVTKGKVVRGYLGLSLATRELSPALLDALGAPAGTKGALVGDVASATSPAAKAGVKANDIITQINGKPVASGQELTSAVADLAPGTVAELKGLREGKEVSFQVTLGERPTNVGGENEESGPSGPDARQSRQKLGVTLTEVTPDVVDQLKLKIASGAVITGVAEDSPAGEAGLRRGDVIHRIGRTTVESVQDLTSALANAQGEIALQIERGGQLVFVTVTLE